MTDEELIEQVARALNSALAFEVERDVYAGETTHEERCAIARAILPIIKAERAEVVAEIVAWLNRRAGQVLQLHAEAKTDHERNIVDEHASALEQSAIEIEAKFGGRYETR